MSVADLREGFSKSDFSFVLYEVDFFDPFLIRLSGSGSGSGGAKSSSGWSSFEPSMTG